MKKVFNLIGLALVLLLAFSSCQKAPFLSFTGQKSFTFTDAGGSETITFTCNRAWSVTSSESWLTVSPAKGEANEEGAKVTITCAANTTYDPRNATVTILSEGLSESISVSQETNYGLIVSPTTFNLTNAEQVIEIEVQKNVQYSVAIDKNCSDWISLGGTKALTTDIVTIHIGENKSYDDREGKITFKRVDGDLSQTVTIKQSQKNGLFITTSEYDLSNENHNLSVEVKANVEFEVSTQEDWIKIVETKALNSSTISLIIDANESYDNRTGAVIVKQTNGDLTGTITINQHQTDGLFVSPTAFDLANTEQSVVVEVEQNVAYNVVIPDDAKTWITVAGGSQTKALTKETVTLNIAKNTTYDDREASVTIKQVDGSLAETVRIKQAHGEGLIIEKNVYIVAQAGETIVVDVKSNVEFVVKPQTDWIKIVNTKALSTSSVSLSVDKNPGEDRNGTVTFSKEDGSLAATITIVQAGPLVDLGLSVKWAKCNIGASDIGEYGGIYLWAGTNDFSYLHSHDVDYSLSPYFSGTNTKLSWSKYVSSSSSEWWGGTGEPDNKMTLDPEDDVAQVVLGDDWRMPTAAEWQELLDNCTCEPTDNFYGTGVAGLMVRSKKTGYTHKLLFFPADRYRKQSINGYDVMCGTYLSSSLSPESSSVSYCFYFCTEFNLICNHARNTASYVRPVKK